MAVPEIFAHLADRFPDAAYKNVNMRGGFISIDAYHIVERLTDAFESLCGQNWGIHVDEFQHFDKCVAAVGHLWYKLPGTDTIYKVPAVGEGQQRGGSTPDAMKAAQTNMMSKAASYIGIGLSVYKGQHIDAPTLSVGVEVEERPIRPATKSSIFSFAEKVTTEEIETVSNGKKTSVEELTEAEGKHLESVLLFEELVTRVDDGKARRKKWLAAQGVDRPGEVSMEKVRQVIKALRETLRER